MAPKNRLFAALTLLAAVVVSPRNSSGQSGVPDVCAQTAQMDVYSDAQVSRVTGDLSGFDLALDKPNGSQRKALLFVYEGGGSVYRKPERLGNGFRRLGNARGYFALGLQLARAHGLAPVTPSDLLD
jgi:hypothetical protein